MWPDLSFLTQRFQYRGTTHSSTFPSRIISLKNQTILNVVINVLACILSLFPLTYISEIKWWKWCIYRWWHKYTRTWKVQLLLTRVEPMTIRLALRILYHGNISISSNKKYFVLVKFSRKACCVNIISQALPLPPAPSALPLPQPRLIPLDHHFQFTTTSTSSATTTIIFTSTSTTTNHST